MVMLDDPAKEVLKDAHQDLINMCQHVRGNFDKAKSNLRKMETMSIDFQLQTFAKKKKKKLKRVR